VRCPLAPGLFHLWTILYKIFSYKKIWTILIRIPVRFEPDPGGKNLTLYQPHESRSRRLKTCGSGSTKLNKSKKHIPSTLKKDHIFVYFFIDSRLQDRRWGGKGEFQINILIEFSRKLTHNILTVNVI